jgi:hypothetical protein
LPDDAMFLIHFHFAAFEVATISVLLDAFLFFDGVDVFLVTGSHTIHRGLNGVVDVLDDDLG